MRIAGIDPAWGHRNPDGLCLLEDRQLSRIALLPGPETAATVLDFAPDLIAVDAPVVVPNQTGGRPVDRQVTSRFHAQKVACYPGNRKNCARILELVEPLTAAGFIESPDPKIPRPLIEVYPHLSILAFFQLKERLLYKKGPVAAKRVVFGQLQELLRSYLDRHQFTCSPQIEELLETPWSKKVEDQTDAILCALTGHLHLGSGGEKTTHLGCDREGFLVYPLSPHDPSAS